MASRSVGMVLTRIPPCDTIVMFTLYYWHHESKQASEHASKQESKGASKTASKQASKGVRSTQSSKQSKQRKNAGNQAGRRAHTSRVSASAGMVSCTRVAAWRNSANEPRQLKAKSAKCYEKSCSIFVVQEKPCGRGQTLTRTPLLNRSET